jgi:subtilisin family serine protease
MKYSVLLLVLLAEILTAQSTYFIRYKSETPQTYVQEKIGTKKLLDTRLYKGTPLEYKVDYLAKGLAREDNVLGRIIKVSFGNNGPSEDELYILLNDPMIEYVQQGRTYTIDYIPNDSLLTEQWALAKIGAFDAWDLTTGSDTIILAVIDTGIDYLHPDLKNQIKYNEGEMGLDDNGNDKRFNGIDDDGNGFIDDYMGWDFTDRLGFPFDSTGGDYLVWDNDPYDNNGHGTYIAGVAAAEANNLHGISGAAPGIKVLNVRAFDPNGYGEEDDAAAAILYAVQMGAKVINMSFGDNSFSYVLRDVIKYAYSQNVVLVASSGNRNSDQPHYPSGYTEVMSVGNSTENDAVASNSNYGSNLDLVAPGTFIKTTGKNGSYVSASGTSLAAPFVSAAAALLLSRGDYTNDEIKQILKSTADDIGTTGWDIRSGAGRLNIAKALSVTAPSIIKFNYPGQDFATLEDTLTVSATVLSAYFLNYELYIGAGVNPSVWNKLTSGLSQFINSEIFTLSVSNLPDSVYTLRLLVNQSNGRTTEERINFHISRTPPVAELISLGSALYGNESTILASLYTDVPSIVKMYFRRSQTNDVFKFITLDGFAINNQFVKYLHYGFIPKELVEPNQEYEVYLEAENLTGLTTVVKDGNSNFFVRTSFRSAIASEYELPFRLPFGDLYRDPVSITGDDFSELLLNAFYPGADSYYGIYKFNGNGFDLPADSLKNKFPRDIGDFNGNGRTDILSTFQRNGFIDEQTHPDSITLINRLTDTSGRFWAAKVEDINGDGNPQVIVINSDTTLAIWNLDDNLNKTDSVVLQNYSPKWYGNNWFVFPRVQIADTDGDGYKEIWTVDNDGDIIAWEYDGTGFVPFYMHSTYLLGTAEYITAGDFNGDGNQDIAVMLRSIQNLYIAPFNYLLVFNRDRILFEQAFLDPSAEFSTNFPMVWNSIRFVDIDNDSKDELVVFSFPYSYIFKHQTGGPQIISYQENINSRSVFVSDLNKNGVPEVAFPFPDGIRFMEFAVSNKTPTPFHVDGFSIDSNFVHLNWTGDGEKFFIYRGTEKNNLLLYDSTLNNTYEDISVVNLVNYFYAVKAFSSQKEHSYSDLSNPISVYIHNTTRITNVESKSPNSVQVHFGDRINTTVLNLQSFRISTGGESAEVFYPLSVSSATQYSYLLTFDKVLPEGTAALSVTDLRDYYRSPVKEETVEFIIKTVLQTENLFITSHQIINQFRIRIDFNLEVDPSSASVINNYSFEPLNFIQHIEVDQLNKNIVYINLEKRRPVGSVGVEYKLTISDIYSSENTGSRKISPGAGSIIVLTTFEADLSNVFVYPNPVKAGEGHTKVTFAGLPQKARIIIFSINGDKLKSFDENNGDGGVSIDLIDDNGQLFSSGVYFYRVVRLDESNNEVEEKLGKFAVLR